MADLPNIGIDWGQIDALTKNIGGNLSGIIDPHKKLRQLIEQSIAANPQSAQQYANLGGDQLQKLYGKRFGSSKLLDSLTTMGPDAATLAQNQLKTSAPTVPALTPQQVTDYRNKSLGLDSTVDAAAKEVDLDTKRVQNDLAKFALPYEKSRIVVTDELNKGEAKVKLDALNNLPQVQGADFKGLVDRMYGGKLKPEDNVLIMRIQNTPGAAQTFRDLIEITERKSGRQLELFKLNRMIAAGRRDDATNYLRQRYDNVQQNINIYKGLKEKSKLSPLEELLWKKDGNSPDILAAKAKKAQLDDADNVLKSYEKELGDLDIKQKALLGGNSDIGIGASSSTTAPNTSDSGKLGEIKKLLSSGKATIEGLLANGIISKEDVPLLRKKETKKVGKSITPFNPNALPVSTIGPNKSDEERKKKVADAGNFGMIGDAFDWVLAPSAPDNRFNF